MAYAVVLHIREINAPHVQAAWNIFTQKDGNGGVQFSDDQIDFNYPSHASPAIIEDSADAHSLFEVLTSLAKKLKPTPLRLTS